MPTSLPSCVCMRLRLSTLPLSTHSSPGRNAELVEAGDGAPLGGRVVLVVPPLPAAQAEAVALHGVPPCRERSGEKVSALRQTVGLREQHFLLPSIGCLHAGSTKSHTRAMNPRS